MSIEIDDREYQIRMFSMVCGRCVNLASGNKRVCRAFPNGIPAAIWNNKNNHKKQYPGDNDIIFIERK